MGREPSGTITLILAAAMALLGCTECPEVPGLTRSECEQVRGLRLPSSIPASSQNALSDNQDAAMLGHQVFFDARFSSNQEVRCGTCHEPALYFTDADPVSTGLEKVRRNSPSLYIAPFLQWQMWDGRADSLWSQPLLAFENVKEMDFTRLEIAHRIAASYRAKYEALFGALPPLDDATRFPARGKPGDAAWEAMTVTDRAAIDEIAINVGKAIEAYERKLAMRPGRFEAFLDGDTSALSTVEREGLRVFIKAQCATCHGGPLFTDESFHALVLPEPEGQTPERGRAEALEVLARSPFKLNEVPLPTAADELAWHTPSLRNVARTAPYGHNGVFPTLSAVFDFHVPTSVTKDERTALLAFMNALTAGDPPAPWNNWPNR